MLLPSFTFARSLSIDSYSIDYTLNKDGIVNVSEKLQYTLNGCYTELYLQRPTSLKILNANGFCEDKECTFRHDLTNTPTGDQELVLKSSYCDETVIVNFSYDITNVVNQLQDGNFQFYYKLYGEGTNYSTSLNISLTFPGDIDNTEYFLHSDDYSLDINNNRMEISKKVIPNEIIEINLLMPSDWFVKTDNINADKLTSSQVRELEENWDVDYKEYQKSITPFSFLKKVIIFFIIILIPIITLFLIWKRHSKEFSREEVSFFEEYYRELPVKEQDPLLANYFLNEKFSSNWFSSGIMYLVWKEVYSLEKEDKDYFLQRTNKEVSLPSYIKEIDLFLIKYFKNNKFNVKDIEKYLRGSISFGKNYFEQMALSQKFRTDFTVLYNKIQKEYDTKFYKNKEIYDKRGRKIAITFSLIFLPIAFIYSLTVTRYMPGLFIFIITFTVFISILVNSRHFGRFTKEGRVINLKWMGFKKYITDFSDIKNHPPKHVILWEEYLVYATAFGIAKEVSKNIKTLTPENYENNTRLGVYSGFIASSSFSNLNAVSSSSGSSGSSGGGSGGGFGGGGGGGGAGGR